ncbi:MAG: M14 family metallocarboxypeptidase [Phycisphaerae bacterium]|nr:hypothetical protein [Phycisphaerae bacterium]MCZ2400662.1 M14 family metallocarboxypeptidase [Phycisphaerae bacterium]NUQ48657.1 hypothetical protein [Phycisphaerae bacterium]
MRFNVARSGALLCLLTFSAFAWAHDPLPTGVDYTGHALVEVILNTPADVDRFQQDVSPHFMSCSPMLGKAPYRIPPDRMDELKASGFKYTVLSENIQELIDRERRQIEQVPADSPWFDTYHTYAEVGSYLDTLVALRPDLASRFHVGYSIENREIFGIKITGPNAPPDRRAVIFHGCQHAREWISVSVPMYIADQLIREYDNDPQIKAVVDSTVFYIIPIVNPDGYVYTWGPDRLWRKNRRNNGNGTWGVDNNRNWGYQWGGAGSSGDGSSEVYRGTAPFSEPETAAMRDFIEAHPEIVAHIDFHSYAQLVMSPWAYVAAEPPAPDRVTFNELTAGMANAIQAVHGAVYTPGPVGIILYLASGGSLDWTYGARGILGFTIELRPVGNPGFELPPQFIRPTSQENFAAIMMLAQYLQQGLVFDFPFGLPQLSDPAGGTLVQTDVRPIATDLGLDGVKLRARVGDQGAFAVTNMTQVGPYSYQGPLPAAPCGQTVQFYVQATGLDGNVYTSPADAPNTVYSAPARKLVTLVDHDMETNQGWTVGAPDDNATSGIWERANPQGTVAQPEDDHTPDPGVLCYVTGAAAGQQPGSNDVDGGKTTLFSPVFNLSAYPDAVVSYWRWYSNSAGAAPNTDIFLVDITNNGTTWVNAETVGPAGPETNGGWFYHEFRVSDVVTPTATVRLRFIAQDLGQGSLVEAALDDFRIAFVEPCPPTCPGDLDGDGVVGQGDLGVLLANFGCNNGIGNCPGDIDGDGDTDQGDLGVLLAAFGEPCP